MAAPSPAPSSPPDNFFSPDPKEYSKNKKMTEIGIGLVLCTMIYILHTGHYFRFLLVGGLLGVLVWYYISLKQAIANQDMAKKDVIKKFNLQKLALKDVHGKSFDIYVQENVPVSPTLLDVPVSGKRTAHIGTDYENVIGNPRGNIIPRGTGPASATNQTFVPYDPTNNLYWAEDKTSDKFVLSIGKTHTCPADKKGTFVQDVFLVSKSGHCACDGYVGPQCEFSDALTCHNRGTAQSDGTCQNCKASYGTHCETVPATCPNSDNCYVGCHVDGSVCSDNNDPGFGCPHCRKCCGCNKGSCTGCGAGQTQKCKDHNKSHYPCVCDHKLWSSGGVLYEPQPIDL